MREVKERPRHIDPCPFGLCVHPFAALCLPCFRLVTPDGLQVTLEPMDRRQAQLQYIDYKLHALQGKQAGGRKRRNVNGDDKLVDPHDPPVQHAAIARDRENRPQQPRLTERPRPAEEAVVERADALGHDPVEPPDLLDARRRHSLTLVSKLGGVNCFGAQSGG